MKSLKISMAVAVSALMISAPAMAFHDGGVAQCESCHTMHNSKDGAAMGGGTALTPGVFLLQGGGSQSDACLNCHEKGSAGGPSSYGVSTPKGELVLTAADATTGAGLPMQKGPGGDFAWLNFASGSTTPSNRGHNIVAPSHNYVAETRFAANGNVSPGGTYPVAALQCSSCHDPHGKYRRDKDGIISTTGAAIASSGSYDTNADPLLAGEAVGVYRLLGGKGYLPKGAANLSAPAFDALTDPPMAVAPATYNRTENDPTKLTHVAYGKGMSEWCANCHGGLLSNSYASGNAGGHTHPAGNSATLTAEVAGNYNNYLGTGVTPAAAKYDTLVPFEEGGAVTWSTLKTHAKNDESALITATAGTSNVMCLSCHRVHASGFASMTRYDVSTLMTVEDAGTTKYSADGVVAAFKTAAYYGRPAAAFFVAEQRALCNKCHAKD